MKEKDTIEQLFERLEGTFDVHESPAGHQNRFLEKLVIHKITPVRRLNWWKPLSIAASVLLLICTGLIIQNNETQPEGLAGVSPEMAQTQTFFISTINQELETLKGFQNEDTELLIADTMERLEILEREFGKLKIDLVQSGNDKRVISAMINNFQNRIELLQRVIESIEEIKTLKANRNETTI